MDEDLVKIYTAADNAQADIIKGILAESEILAYVQGYHHHSLFGAIGGFVALNILVPAHQAEEAAKILKEHLEPTMPPALEQQEPSAPPIRSARVAFILPFFLPGLGSCYVGRGKRGGLIMVISLLCFVSAWMEFPFDSPLQALILILILVGLLIFDAITSSLYLKRKK